ncbi:hypothetical protein GO730_38090 [Spirosoma sp. HMF3257]|uniref:Uncharacterized protein n=1 Tax=Spirosoma telluris TaxID=2183553 RepID=A0A327NCW5_9BACT|nr:hypothetical protein [Spirosoma telluris]MVM42132.1 hypothetical protein [Spirosoma telluris]RAI73047.1 hypothetical protein HMF3257_37220 [Spirosoma telluris]RAI73178.1 hypothetical protein HMF3257_37990 [Spirosoma telluris]
MRHPIEKYNQQQAEVLANLPEDQRDYMARMFRIGNATYTYHNQVKELAVFGKGSKSEQTTGDLLDWLEQRMNLTDGTSVGDRIQTESRSARELLEVYFEEYLAGLPHDGLRRAEKDGGLDKAKNSYPFRRYVLERHDLGMDEFLRQNLSEEDYAFHIECGKPLSDEN